MATQDFVKIRTYVSGAFWCDPGGPTFEEAKRPEAPSLPLCWLDELLDGGITIPGSPAGPTKRAVTILLTGPPGTGKSTLATELCYRWAAAESFRHFYYATTEADPLWLVGNAKHIWGKEAPQQFCEKIEVAEYIPLIESQAFANKTERDLAKLLGLSVNRETQLKFRAKDHRPDVVVIDSLNVIPDDSKKKQWLDEILKVVRDGPQLVILVMDAGSVSKAMEFWEYISDIIIRLDHTSPSSPTDGYLLRTIEIVKARYQHHAWGPHQLKLYEAYDIRQLEGESREKYYERLRRAHPFRRQGGVFIYPSIHYLLSTYKRSDPSSGPRPIPPRSRALGWMLEGGFPEGRCTALLGARGGHKSYLGFMHVVDRVVSHDECGLIISLRDDVGITVASINKIMTDWAEDDKCSRNDKQRYRELRSKWDDGLLSRLEIMYFPPGNITPEEFLHRILLSVWRLRGKTASNNVTVLFNSLDQLAPRFPLCAKEPVFIAALLQLLCANSVTSLFVAASTRTEDATYHGPDSIHGVDSIAELILDFQQDRLTQEEQQQSLIRFFGVQRLRQPPAEKIKGLVERWNAWLGKPQVVIRVVRHAGGHPAGARAILELIERDHPLAKMVPPGLQCFPLGLGNPDVSA